MSLGLGISLSNAIASLEGLFGKPGEFVRTPKFGVTEKADRQWKKRASTYKPRKKWWVMPVIELAVGFYMLSCMVYCLTAQMAMALPFLALFMVGYFYVGLTSLFAHLAALREPAKEPREAVQAVGVADRTSQR